MAHQSAKRECATGIVERCVVLANGGHGDRGRLGDSLLLAPATHAFFVGSNLCKLLFPKCDGHIFIP